MAISLKSWSGSIEEIYNLIVNDSWVVSYNETSTFDYTPEFLGWYMENPAVRKDDMLVLYDDDELVGFCVCVRRNYLLNGEVVTGLFATALSVKSSDLRKGYGSIMCVEFLKKYKALYQETGEPEVLCYFNDDDRPTSYIFPRANDDIGVTMNKLQKVNLQAKIFSVERLGRIENIKPYEKVLMMITGKYRRYKGEYSQCVEEYNQRHLPRCLELVNKKSAAQDFSPIFEQEELGHYLQYKGFSNTLVFEFENRVIGLIQYRIITLTGKKTTEKFGFIDWLCDQELSKNQAKALISACLDKIKSADVIAAIYCDMPILKDTYLKYFSFLPYPRKVFLSTSVFDKDRYPFDNVVRSYEPIS